jgi:hypothetical protein
MNDHQLWLDMLNYHQQRGLTLAQAAEQCYKWPFKYVNGQQTPESEALEALPPEKPLKGYDAALLETNDEALI